MISPRKWERLLTAACDVTMLQTSSYKQVYGDAAYYICSERALRKIETLDHYNTTKCKGVTEKTMDIVKRNFTVDAIAWRIEAMYLARHTMTHVF